MSNFAGLYRKLFEKTRHAWLQINIETAHSNIQNDVTPKVMKIMFWKLADKHKVTPSTLFCYQNLCLISLVKFCNPPPHFYKDCTLVTLKILEMEVLHRWHFQRNDLKNQCRQVSIRSDVLQELFWGFHEKYILFNKNYNDETGTPKSYFPRSTSFLTGRCKNNYVFFTGFPESSTVMCREKE